MAAREIEEDVIVLRELAVKPMRKVGRPQSWIDRLVARALVRRTRNGWMPTEVGRAVLEGVGQTVH